MIPEREDIHPVIVPYKAAFFNELNLIERYDPVARAMALTAKTIENCSSENP